jgi:hypothetical protein
MEITFTPCACSGSMRRPSRVEGPGLARTVDVGIQDPDPGPVERQRERQVHGRRRLADPTFARGDRQHVADAGQGTQVALDGMGPHLPVHPDLAGPELRPGVDQRLQRGLQLLLVSAHREAEFDVQDGPIALESDGFHSFGFV